MSAPATERIGPVPFYPLSSDPVRQHQTINQLVIQNFSMTQVRRQECLPSAARHGLSYAKFRLSGYELIHETVVASSAQWHHTIMYKRGRFLQLLCKRHQYIQEYSFD